MKIAVALVSKTVGKWLFIENGRSTAITANLASLLSSVFQ